MNRKIAFWSVTVAVAASFAAMMVLQLLFVLFLTPDSKGRGLESLAEGLSRHAHTN